MDQTTTLSPRTQVRAIGAIFVVGAVVLVLAFAIARLLANVYDRNVVVIFDDPASAFNGPLYTGAFAYLGFLGWWTAVVATGMAGSLLAARRQWAGAEPLLVLTSLSVVLAFDDMFQIHEGVLVRLGVSQQATFLAYGFVFGVITWRYRTFVRSGYWLLPAFAVSCFCLAALADQITDETGRHFAAPEEALELLGIFAWALYGVANALRYLTVIDTESREKEPGRVVENQA